MFDLTAITPLQSTGDAFPATGGKRCAGAVSVRKISANGAYGTEYYYYSTMTDNVLDGWYQGLKADAGTKIASGDVTLQHGEGLIIYCSKSDGAQLQFSGQVDLTDNTYAIPNGYSFSGNCTPVAIDLTAITPVQSTGEVFPATGGKRCAGAVSVRKISANGAYGTEYYYYSTMTDNVLDGWYQGLKADAGTKVSVGDVVLEP